MHSYNYIFQTIQMTLYVMHYGGILVARVVPWNYDITANRFFIYLVCVLV